MTNHLMTASSEPDDMMKSLYPSEFENWVLTSRFAFCQVCLVRGICIRTPMRLHFDGDDTPGMPCCSVACAKATGQELRLRQEPKNPLAAVLSSGPLLDCVEVSGQQGCESPVCEPSPPTETNDEEKSPVLPGAVPPPCTTREFSVAAATPGADVSGPGTPTESGGDGGSLVCADVAGPQPV